MEGGMKTSSVMRFEDLVRLWQDGRPETSILELLGITTCADDGSSGTMDSLTLENLCEKLRGTWWEVIWPTLSARHGLYRGVRCRYLADSLQDAMRLYPNAGFPAHGAVENAEDFAGDDDTDETVEEPSPFESAAAGEV
jgi:hypothetical protein